MKQTRVDIPRHKLPKQRLLLFERTHGSAPGRKNDDNFDAEDQVEDFIDENDDDKDDDNDDVINIVNYEKMM